MTQALKKWELATQELTDKFIRKYFGKDPMWWWVWGKRVRLGFRNEENLKVWRGEVWDKMQLEKFNN